MTREEAVKMLQATRLMLMDGANQPISDLYYALDMAIEALEQTEPIIKDVPQTDGILFGGNLKEGDYKLIKATDGWVLEGEDIAYAGWEKKKMQSQEANR